VAFARQGREELARLCSRKPAITEIDTIYQINQSLSSLGMEDESRRKLWERAAAAKPDDRDIAFTWLEQSIDEADWLSAQKV
jgi:N-terminal acetyltransferase B complex non-catalytic subunit